MAGRWLQWGPQCQAPPTHTPSSWELHCAILHPFPAAVRVGGRGARVGCPEIRTLSGAQNEGRCVFGHAREASLGLVSREGFPQLYPQRVFPLVT